MKGDGFVVLMDNRVRFTTTHPVTVEEVVESLRGMDRMVRAHFPRAIKQITGAKVKSAEVLVNSIEEGSLFQDTVVKLIFGTEKQKDKFIKSIRDKFVSKNSKGETVVKGWVAGSLLAALAIVSIAWWQSSSGSPAQGGLVTNNGDNNVVMIIGAEAYKTQPAAFEKAVEESLKQQEHKINAAKAGVQFFTPSRNEPGAGLELLDDTATDGKQSVVIASGATVQKMPDKIERLDQSNDVSYSKVVLKLRATDNDSIKSGWAGTIERIAEARTRVIFTDPADISKVMHKPQVDADVSVTYSDASHSKAILIVVDKVY